MGCDIHGTIEWKPDDPVYGGRWVAVSKLTNEGRWRNYKRFAALAGVRGDGPEANGAPPDMSDSTRLELDDMAGDAHSACWFPLAVAVMLFKGTEQQEWLVGSDKQKYFEHCPEYLYFGLENLHKPMSQYRVVCWFDN